MTAIPAYRSADIGVDLGVIDATPQYRLGSRAFDQYGVPYIYCKAYGSITNTTRHNVLNTSSSTSSNATGAWVNTTGSTVASGSCYWAQRYIASNLIDV